MRTILATFLLLLSLAPGRATLFLPSAPPTYFTVAGRTMFTAPTNIASLPMPAVMQANLAAYYRSDSLVLTNGSFVLGWHDLHNTYNQINPDGNFYDAIQSAAPYLAFATNDFQGRPSVLFPWVAPETGVRPSSPFANSSLPLASTVNFTAFAVASCSDFGEIAHINSWGFPYLSINITRQLGFALTFGASLSPVNKTIYIISSGGGASYTYLNGVLTTNSATGETSATGITIGNNFAGRLYQVGVIGNATTPDQMQQIAGWLASDATVRTNYDTRVTCIGDSMTAGIGSTNLQAWPYQLYEGHPGLLVYNFGISGSTIPTSSSDPGIDANFDAACPTNILVMMKGVNNMLNGDSAATIYQDLTNYLAARQAAGFAVIPVTLANTESGTPSIISTYNALIRDGTNTSGIYTSIADPGWNSPVETRLNDASDLTYFFSDGLHLVNAGYGVVEEHVENRIFSGTP